ncbi:MAG: hypothetical protein OEX19_00875 [Gammaproteobacteria bacterium]|nr:hypothetical protein [Gammaproteobacteria bacterium]
MSDKTPSALRFSTMAIGLAAAFSLSLSGCIPENLTNDSGTVDEGLDDTTTIEAPQITMNLPVTLSGVIAQANASNKAGMHKMNVREVSDPGECEVYFDPHSNFMENGFAMSRFLVGLSQQQSCFADFIMGSIVAQGGIWVNKGPIAIPANPNDPGAPSHVQIEQSGDTTQVWLYFTTHGVDLPADKSDLQALYLTWTGSGTDVTGQFFMVNMPVNPEDPDAPEGLRVDFVRTASTASNKIYLDMRTGHSAGMGGFRIDVSQTGTGSSATYEAKGLISFLGQPFPNLPAGLDFPEFAAAAVVDAAGLGASSANFNKFAVSLVNDKNSDGTIDSADGEFDLGTYQFNINDTTYFNPSLYDATNTTTPFVTQVNEWRNKSVNNADYVADHPIIEQATPAGLENYTMLKCLERDICDYDGDGVLNANGQTNEWEGWSLGEGYFTNTCIDTAGTVGNDCTAFVNGFFQAEMFGVGTLNSTDAEPTGDWRNEKLNALTQLTSVHPDDDTTGATTFDFPAPPAK